MGVAIEVKDLNAWFGKAQVSERDQHKSWRQRGDGRHRPFGLRQVHIYPLPEPDA